MPNTTRPISWLNAARNDFGDFPADVQLEALRALTVAAEGGKADQDAQRLMEEREVARADKDFARADALRDELAAMGYEVRDSAEGPRLVAKS